MPRGQRMPRRRDGSAAVRGGRVRGGREQRVHSVCRWLVLVGGRSRVLRVPCWQRVPSWLDGAAGVREWRVCGGHELDVCAL